MTNVLIQQPSVGSSGRRLRRLPGTAGAATIAVAVLGALVLPAVANAYTVSIASTALVLAVLAMSTQLLTGVAGLPSLGQAAYLGVGAYTAALLANTGVTNGPVQLGAAALGGAAAAAVTAPLVLRTRGTAALMVTFAVAELAQTIATQWSGVTGGSEGLHTPPVTLWPGGAVLRADGFIYLYLLGCILVIATLFAVLLRSPTALALRGAADHEPRLAALGHHVTATLFTGHVAAGAIAGAGGAMLVAANRYLSPADMSLDISALALLACAIGMRSMRGAVAGAVLIIAVRDLLGATTGGHALALLGLVFLFVAYRPPLTQFLRACKSRRQQ